MYGLNTDIGQIITKKNRKCGKCSNCKVIFGGLHCEGYGCFNYWTKKCAENMIIGNLQKERLFNERY